MPNEIQKMHCYHDMLCRCQLSMEAICAGDVSEVLPSPHGPQLYSCNCTCSSMSIRCFECLGYAQGIRSLLVASHRQAGTRASCYLTPKPALAQEKRYTKHSGGEGVLPLFMCELARVVLSAARLWEGVSREGRRIR